MTYACSVGIAKETKVIKWTTRKGDDDAEEENGVAESCAGSYLAFDVYFTERRGTKVLEERCTFSDLDSKLVAVFRFDEVLRTVGIEKFTTCFIVLEAKFVSNETKGNMRVSVNCQCAAIDLGECTYPLAILARALRRSRSMNMSMR